MGWLIGSTPIDHTVATCQISVIFRVLKIWVWKTYLTKVIEYNLILYTILEVAWFLRIVYKSSHKKLFSISTHNRCRIIRNWQLFNHFCLPHFGLRQITNTLEMTHRVSQWWSVENMRRSCFQKQNGWKISRPFQGGNKWNYDAESSSWNHRRHWNRRKLSALSHL